LRKMVLGLGHNKIVLHQGAKNVGL
jgi:hypothetical protein